MFRGRPLTTQTCQELLVTTAHGLVEVTNHSPGRRGLTSGPLMSGGEALSCPQSPRRAPRGAVEGGQEGAERAGRSVVGPTTTRLLPAGAGCGWPSGLGRLLAARGAGREPGGGALLRAEAVLVLRGRGREAQSVRDHRAAPRPPVHAGRARGNCASARARVCRHSPAAAGAWLVCDDRDLSQSPSHSPQGETPVPAAPKATMPAANTCGLHAQHPPASHDPADGPRPAGGRVAHWAGAELGLHPDPDRRPTVAP